MRDDYRPLSQQSRSWVEAALGPNARVLAASRLPGGLTSDMDRLTVAVGGRRCEVVLRRWFDHEWGPGLIDRESVGLQALARHDLPVPRLVAADRTGEKAGEPALLMTALPGGHVFNPPDLGGFVGEMATTLVRIHGIAPTGLAWTDPHGFDVHRVRRWVRDPALAQAVIEAVGEEPVGRREPVLVHGDYQPFNLLWSERGLSGVVDWAYVGSGRREVDVGLSRLSLAALFSAAAAEDFLRRYEAEGGVRVDVRLDIRALLAFEPSWLDFVSARMARSRPPIRQRSMATEVEAVLRTAVRRLA